MIYNNIFGFKKFKKKFFGSLDFFNYGIIVSMREETIFVYGL
jgi:hypothetical protein